MMLATSAIDDTMDERLVARDFYRESHGRIFDAILAMYMVGDPVDPLTLRDKLAERGELDKAGGEERIRDIASIFATVSNVRHWAKIVRDLAVLRAMISAGHEVTRLGWERGGSIPELLDRAEGVVFDLSQERRTGDFATIQETVQEAFSRLQTLSEGSGGVLGCPSGYRPLDGLTGGFQPGNLIVLAARPSMGKTGLALGITTHVAIRHGKPVAVFSLEMSRSEVTQRFLSSEGLVESSKLRTGQLDGEEWRRVTAAAARLDESRILIDDSSTLTAMELRSKARKVKLRHPDLALIVVDYIQLMTSGGRAENRVQDVSQISRAMKVLARELDVPVLALSQLSRQVEQRHDKRPILSDLRESGAIEQDADLVAFIYRDEYYNPEDETQAGIAEVNLAKHRNGPTGTVRLSFVRKYVRFSDLQLG